MAMFVMVQLMGQVLVKKLLDNHVLLQIQAIVLMATVQMAIVHLIIAAHVHTAIVQVVVLILPLVSRGKIVTTPIMLAMATALVNIMALVAEMIVIAQLVMAVTLLTNVTH